MSVNKYVDCNIVAIPNIFMKTQVIYQLNEYFILDAYFRALKR